MKRLLLTGASGQLGRELTLALSAHFDIVAPGRAELDLMRPDMLRKAVRSLQPAVIVNAAAWTDVESAEMAPDQAMAINGLAPGILAEEAARCNAVLLHYSTDYVFDGDTRNAYTETDNPAPLNVYGHSKYAGEQAVAAVGGRYLILRTSWLYGAHGRNFLKTVLRLAASNTPLRIVDDQFGAPTWTRDLAHASALLLTQAQSGSQNWWQTHAGLYHVAGSGQASWYRFASNILATSGQDTVPVLPVCSAEYGAIARRPKTSVLDCSLFATTFGIPALPEWQESLRNCCSELETNFDPPSP